MHFYIFYKFDLCRFWYTVCFCRNCINLLKNLLGINLGNLCISYLWVACFLGEINKIFEFLGLLYFYRVKMNYYLYRNPVSQNLDKSYKLTNIKSVLFYFLSRYLLLPSIGNHVISGEMKNAVPAESCHMDTWIFVLPALIELGRFNRLT